VDEFFCWPEKQALMPVLWKEEATTSGIQSNGSTAASQRGIIKLQKGVLVI
jgi:hypothetical protein